MSPFLRLPLEIRKHIYEYIIPNTNIYNWETISHRPQFRDDGVCSSSILRVNRKIYRELYGDWYRKATYTLRLEHNRTVFVNQHIPIGEALPSTILAIRSLDILLFLAPNHVSVDGFRTRTHHIRTLANMLSSGKSSLEKLQLRAVASFGALEPVRDGGSPYEILEANLQPFQSVRGLSQVSVSVSMSHAVAQFFSQPEGTVNGKWVTGAREYLDTLESIMMLPRVLIEGRIGRVSN